MSLVAGLDNRVVDLLIGALTHTVPAVGTTVTLPLFLRRWASAVNGIAARSMEEVKWLVGTVPEAAMANATYPTLMALASVSTVPGMFDLFRSDRFRGSAHINATSSTDRQSAIAIRTGPAPPRLIVPVWRRGEIHARHRTPSAPGRNHVDWRDVRGCHRSRHRRAPAAHHRHGVRRGHAS